MSAPAHQQEILAREVAFQASLLDEVRSAVIATDPEGVITHWNRHAEVLYRWTRDEALGQSIFSVTTPNASRAEAAEILRQVAASGTWEGEFEVRRRDRTTFPAFVTLSAIRDPAGELAGFVGVSFDISERKRAEDAARAGEAHLQLALESAELGTWDLDIATGAATCSATLYRIYGYEEPPEEWSVARFLPHVFAEDRPAVEAAIASALEGGDCEFDCRIIRYDGRPAWIWAKGRHHLDDQGRPSRLIGVIRDITERKQMEEQLRETQKFESLGILAGGIAHDFNNLLVGVIGNASLAEDLLPEDHEVREFLSEIVEAGSRAAHLTEQMLAYAGKGRRHVAAFDLSQAVREIDELLRSSVSKKASLAFDLAGNLPLMEADLRQIQQVILNLVLNASEAIGTAEGSIAVRTARVFRAAPLSPPHGNCVLLEVRDTGSGMDAATRSRIFEPFFTTRFAGRGLGLAATQGIVRTHKGAIAVESALGRGATFHIVFPAA